MHALKIFSQEIGPTCNLAAAHRRRCPSQHPDRYARLDQTRLMSDDLRLETARIMADQGFVGFYAWHFYNEPLLDIDRITPLQARIRAAVPGAKFLLWTNGSLLGTTVPEETLADFDAVQLSNYTGADWTPVRARFPQLRIGRGRLDRRMTPAAPCRAPCHRIWMELILDAYGNWRPCCNDWQGTMATMNVHTDGFPAILEAYRAFRVRASQDPMPEDLPAVCYTCRVRR